MPPANATSARESFENDLTSGLASAFSAILVYGQELLPGRVGLVSGLFFGFAFGVGGIAAAALGGLADATSIETVYRVCTFLPALGLLTAWLPDARGTRRRVTRAGDGQRIS